jgi:hypothetical protein
MGPGPKPQTPNPQSPIPNQIFKYSLNKELNIKDNYI